MRPLELVKYTNDKKFKQLKTKNISKESNFRNTTASALAIAWVIARGDNIIPIPGTKKIKYLEENIKSVDLKITEEDFKQIDNILNKHLISEKDIRAEKIVF